MILSIIQKLVNLKRPALNVKPVLWYFSHTIAKLTSMNKSCQLKAFYEIFLRDIKWAWFLVYWALRDI